MRADLPHPALGRAPEHAPDAASAVTISVAPSGAGAIPLPPGEVAREAGG
jgi:hypothetical protein